MKSKLFKTLFVFCPIISFTQVDVTYNTTTVTNVTSDDLVNAITGQGVYIVNGSINLNCNTEAFGTFTDPTSSIGLPDGIVLSTGNASNVEGPNDDDGSGGMDYASTYSDPDITALEVSATNDVCLLEFDLVPICDTLKIDYVFGSEEYEEFVGLGFNDAFGFFISGPGISGPYSNGGENIALVPNSTAVVSVDNINATTNSSYYVNNPAGSSSMEYDGYTTALTAESPVIPCETYHLKLIIADASDGMWDSGVLLKLGGLNCPTTSYSASPITVNLQEGCTDGSFTIDRFGDLTTPIDFTFSGNGTAVSGVDYNLPSDFTLLAGQGSQTINVTGISDAITEGTESFQIEAVYTICGFNDTLRVDFTIEDGPFANAGTDQNICDLNTNLSGNYGNASSFNWNSLTSGVSISNLNDLNSAINVSGSGTYQIELIADENGCLARDTVAITLNETPAVFAGTDQNLCQLDATLAGNLTGSGSNIWNTITPGLTLVDNTNLNTSLNASSDGIYLIELVGDNNGCIDRDTVQLTLNTTPIANAGNDFSNCGLSFNLNGAITGNGSFNWSTLDGELSIGNNNDLNSSVTASTEGDFSAILHANNNGCLDSDTVLFTVNFQPNANFSASNLDCFGDAINLQFTGDSTNLTTYNWTIPNGSPNTANTSDVNNVSFSTSGNSNISLSVDNNGCGDSFSLNLFQPDSIHLDTTVVLPNCNNACDGSIEVSATGGSPGFQYNWNNSGNVNNDNYSNLCEGDYTIVVTDANGCQKSMNFPFYGPGALIIDNEIVSDVSCNGDSDGSIELEVTSSNNNYNVNWGFITNNTLSMNALSAGNFHIVVENGNGCIDSVDVTINEPEALDLNLVNSINPLCYGESNGSISVDAIGGNGNNNYFLNNTLVPSTDYNNLGVGIYDIHVIDQNGCMDSLTIELFDPAPIISQVDSVIDLTCANSNDGAIYGTVIGGTGSLTMYLNGMTSNYPLDNLEAGNYTISFIDENNCETNESITINAPEPIQLTAEENSPVCEDNSGNISIETTGGTTPYFYHWLNFPNENSSFLDSLNSGDYTVYIYDINGCMDSTTISINSSTNFEMSIDQNYFEDFTSVDVLSNVSSNINNTTFEWTLGDNVIFDNQLDTTITTPGTHVFYTTGSYGNCSATDSITVVVNEDFGFEIPNIFTPNGDGQNDYFGLSTEQAHLLENVQLEIYNRWGNLIFSSNSQANIKWDGRTIGGSICPTGTYYYVLSFTDNYNRHQSIKSTIILTR